jgi:hypothetical protein
MDHFRVMLSYFPNARKSVKLLLLKSGEFCAVIYAREILTIRFAGQKTD